MLITGGAGFIGSHLVDHLLDQDHQITVLDSLDPQVHFGREDPPDYLAKNIQFIRGDIRDKELLIENIKDIDVVYHLAAAVGVAQSMYQIEKFVDVNSRGTANLLDVLVNSPNQVKKLVVASSMSIYGEGSYQCHDCGILHPQVRTSISKTGGWEYLCPHCQCTLIPVPTSEDKLPDCSTIYALSKKEQEDLCLLVGKTYGLDTTALRFFGTYGSHQALSNPYTGVCAIFSTALLANNPPLIYEDGLQSRDLVHVDDICQALSLAMEKSEAKNEVFNVGTGQSVTILQVAQLLATKLNPQIVPEITHKFRAGDVRHIIADITKISTKLGFKPKYTFEEGITELLPWIHQEFNKKNTSIIDNSSKAKAELEKKGLL